ncbi:DUF11 domain-containing protein [Lysobacter sp. ESA13C]|uniref:DUF11 domain-containing protein n=1 Tax=Lysobacter sp. ESA13C TaxID=2862676 RepID=UPI001CBDD69D|nr:DUF11 domain-containing protein [Lysobacter sp. ESA13C]
MAPRVVSGRSGFMLRGFLALLASGMAVPAFAQFTDQNCNVIWAENNTNPASVGLFRVDPVTLVAQAVSVTNSSTGSAGLAIDARTGYLYIVGNDDNIYRTSGVAGNMTQVATDIDGPGTGPATNKWARATIRNNVLYANTSTPTTGSGTTTHTWTTKRFTVNADGSLTPISDFTITLNKANTLDYTGGDLAQDDNTGRLFMMLNRTGNDFLYFYEVNTTTGLLTPLITSLANGGINNPVAGMTWGSFAAYAGNFYIASGSGNYALLPTDIQSNPAIVTITGAPVPNNGQPGAADMAACGAPKFQITKAGQARDAQGNTASVVIVGSTIDYTVTITNVGSTPATGASWSDALPAGTSYVANTATLNGTNLNQATYPFASNYPINSVGRPAGTMGFLSPNNVATLTFRVLVNSVPAATVTNTATTAFTGPIASPTPNCAVALTGYCAVHTTPVGTTFALAKISNGGVGAFSFTGTNGVAAQTLTTTVAGTAVNGAVQLLTATGVATTVTETAATGYVVSGIACTGLGAGGTATPNLAGRTVTLDAAATAPGATIVCTFTNAGQAALRLQKALPLGRFVTSDQFALTIAGPGAPVSVTTTGSTNLPAEMAVLNPAPTGNTYALSEAGAGGANFANYVAAYACTNALPGGQAPSGAGTSFNVVAVPGDDLTCTLSNTRNPLADLVITKTNTPGSGPSDQAGDTVMRGATTIYTIAVTNNGPDTVTGAVLSDPAAGRNGLTCTAPPTCSGAACPAGLTLAQLESGVALGALANGASVVVTLTCTVN